MPVLFQGREITSVDQKGRTSMPARFRDQLGELRQKDASQISLVPWFGQYIRVFPTVAWQDELARFESYLERIGDQLSLDDEEALRIHFYSGALHITLDQFNRFVMPRELRDDIGVSDEVYWVAAGTHLQLWAPDRFRARFEGDAAASAKSAYETYARAVRRLNADDAARVGDAGAPRG